MIKVDDIVQPLRDALPRCRGRAVRRAPVGGRRGRPRHDAARRRARRTSTSPRWSPRTSHGPSRQQGLWTADGNPPPQLAPPMPGQQVPGSRPGQQVPGQPHAGSARYRQPARHPAQPVRPRPRQPPRRSRQPPAAARQPAPAAAGLALAGRSPRRQSAGRERRPDSPCPPYDPLPRRAPPVTQAPARRGPRPHRARSCQGPHRPRTVQAVRRQASQALRRSTASASAVGRQRSSTNEGPHRRPRCGPSSHSRRPHGV